jgi:hypothetical protein
MEFVEKENALWRRNKDGALRQPLGEWKRGRHALGKLT